MRLSLTLLACLALSACETYTDAVSPCFGTGGASAVTRAAAAPTSPLGAALPADPDCRFAPLGAP